VARPQAPVGTAKVPESVLDHRRRLEALRDRLEAALEDAANRDLAPLAARYQSVLTELATLPEAVESDDVDDLASRRRDRRSGSAG
jgi:hypothetical protein